MNTEHTSRIPGFYKKSHTDRVADTAQWSAISPTELESLVGRGGLTPLQADKMVENALGTYSLPFAVATNFLINGKDYLVPMVIEEPSVVAGASNAARLFREGGGFTTSSDDSLMIGQIQLLEIDDTSTAANQIIEHKQALIDQANAIGGSIVKRGGGARDIEVRSFPDTPLGPMLVIHLLYDSRDAMGANAVNTAVEHIAPTIESITGGRVNLRILSNLTDRRKARAEGMIPAGELARGNLSGPEVVKSIVEAGIFAEIDPYRAATHNKGVMNGIDAVIIATGNDWRAVEAGAHAYAARNGTYTSLSKWGQDSDGNLRGSIELPLAVGIVGGATRVHPIAQVALRIMGIQTARELSEVIAAVGLAQNFAAIRALATEGIQNGHMRMHARQLAVAAGAPDELVLQIARQMAEEGNIRLERAKALVAEYQGKQE